MLKIALLVTLAVAVQALTPSWQTQSWKKPTWTAPKPIARAARSGPTSWSPKPAAKPLPAFKPTFAAAPKPKPFSAPKPIASAPISRAYSPSSDDNEAPTPYAFNYDSVDEYGTQTSRQESGDQSGTITGSYTLQGVNGTRTVTYIADKDGFRAQVTTNEAGTISSNPADVAIQSSASRK